MSIVLFRHKVILRLFFFLLAEAINIHWKTARLSEMYEGENLNCS